MDRSLEDQVAADMAEEHLKVTQTETAVVEFLDKVMLEDEEVLMMEIQLAVEAADVVPLETKEEMIRVMEEMEYNI